jgi:hypothetical protein
MAYVATDGLPVDLEGAAMLRAAEDIMAAIPGTTLIDAARQVEMAWRNADRVSARGHAIAQARAESHRELAAENGTLVTVNLFAAAGSTSVGFSGLAYSGGVISHNDELFAIDLATMTLPAAGRVSLLVNHDSNRIAGHARVEVNGGSLYIREGRFSQATRSGREIAGLHAEGQPLKLSVGVNGRMERLQRATVMLLNARQQTVQAVMRKARLLEVSIVPAGVDPAAEIH